MLTIKHLMKLCVLLKLKYYYRHKRLLYRISKEHLGVSLYGVVGINIPNRALKLKNNYIAELDKLFYEWRMQC